MPRRRYRVIPKYPKEARGAYGVATPTRNGQRRGEFTATFDYTEKKLLSYKLWKQLVRKEIKKRKTAKKAPWLEFKDHDNPYEARFGENWRDHLTTTPGSLCKKFKSTHHLIDHLIAEGNKLFAGTDRADTWLIYHDHLKILWEKQTINYMKSLKCPTPDNPERTWFDRFIKIEGRFNRGLDNRYKNCLPGDSPELMPLDCHLFADIKEALARNVAYSFWMPKGDPRKYDASTPDATFRSIVRTLQNGAPGEKRIIEDCDRIFDETIQRIVDAEGAYIDDKANKSRHGVRGAAAAVELDAQEKFKVDPELEKAFDAMVKDVRAAKMAVPVTFDLTGDDDLVEDTTIDFVSVAVGEEDEEEEIVDIMLEEEG